MTAVARAHRWPALLLVLAALAGTTPTPATEPRDFLAGAMQEAVARIPDGGLLAGRGGVPVPQRVGGHEPRYPASAQRRQLNARVAALARIDARGTVAAAEILATTAPGEGFEEAVLKSVRRWRYAPAIMRGRRVEVWHVIDVRFSPGEELLARRRQTMADRLDAVARDQIIPEGAHIAGENGVTWPVVARRGKVVHPRGAHIRKVASRVLLLVVVDAEGRVADIPLSHAENPEYPFEDAARRSVRNWRFEPASREGSPVTVYHWVTVDFELDS